MARSRVLYVQRSAGGGSAISLLDILRCLDRDRFDPVVLLYEDSRYEEEIRDLGAEIRKLDATRAPKGPIRHISAARARLRSSSKNSASSCRRDLYRFVRTEIPIARRIAAVIKAENITLVHQNGNPRADRASILAARMARKAQVCHVRFLPHYCKLIDRPLARHVGFFLYISEAAEQKFRRDVGVPAEQGEVLRHPIDVDSLTAEAAIASGLRQQLGLQPDARLVTNVGRLVPWKGQHVFVEAMAAVLRRDSKAVGLIVGAAGIRPAQLAYENRLKRLVQSYGLEQRILFIGFRADVPSIMAASDIVVHTSTDPEPFGRVVAEAMAVGRPVIATAAGGPLETIDDGTTGVLVRPDDPLDLAVAIENLLGDPTARDAMGSAARAMVRERHEPERFAHRLHEIYEMVIGASSAGGVPTHVRPKSPIGGIQHAN